MSRRLMNLLFAQAVMSNCGIINDVTNYNVGGNGKSPSDAQKCKPKDLHEFTIKGEKIMASSRKDAIKKYNHLKKK